MKMNSKFGSFSFQDYEPKANTYREQPPLRPPIMSPSDLVYSSVSPRFESLMNRSNPSAWSPQPLDTPGTALQTDFGSNSQRYVKTSDNWHENIVESRTSELWSPSQVQAKPVDIPTRPQYVSQSTKPRDSTSARIFSGKQTERSTNSFAKTNDRANTSHSSSNIPMINR